MDIRSHIDFCRPLNWSLKYRVMLFLAVALVLMPAAIIAAVDSFSDVPASNIFHDDIEAIYGARITNGTSPGIYSPNLLVTREQMAAFLHRGLPRVAYNASGVSILNNTFQEKGVVAITTGGASGGVGLVKLDANLLAFTGSPTGCPCEVQFMITKDGGGQSQDFYVTTYNDQGGVDGNASGSVTWVVQVPTASTQTFRLKVKQNSGTGTVNGAGVITALYVPFGNTGTGTLGAQSIETPDASEVQELKAETNKSNQQ